MMSVMVDFSIVAISILFFSPPSIHRSPFLNSWSFDFGYHDECTWGCTRWFGIYIEGYVPIIGESLRHRRCSCFFLIVYFHLIHLASYHCFLRVLSHSIAFWVSSMFEVRHSGSRFKFDILIQDFQSSSHNARIVVIPNDWAFELKMYVLQ